MTRMATSHPPAIIQTQTKSTRHSHSLFRPDDKFRFVKIHKSVLIKIPEHLKTSMLRRLSNVNIIYLWVFGADLVKMLNEI